MSTSPPACPAKRYKLRSQLAGHCIGAVYFTINPSRIKANVSKPRWSPDAKLLEAMASSTAGGGEHRIEVPSAACGVREVKAAAPEKLLNRFVHLVASLERVGNALGTLAFTWATVVLLGGYPTAFSPEEFGRLTFLVFLEAVRYSSDYTHCTIIL